MQATARVTDARPEVTPAQRGTRAPPIGGGPFRPLQSTPGRVSNVIVFTVERCAGDADEMHPAPRPVAPARQWQAHRMQPRVAGRVMIVLKRSRMCGFRLKIAAQELV